MKLRIRFFAVALTLVMLCTALPGVSYAAPAYPWLITITEPATGETFQGYINGDERFSYYTDAQRNIVEPVDGFFYYIAVYDGEYYPLCGVTSGEAPDPEAVLATSYDRGLQEKLSTLRAMLSEMSRINTFSFGGEDAATPTQIWIPNDYDVNDPKNNDAAYDRIYPDERASMTDCPMGEDCALVVLHVEFNDSKATYGDAEWANRIFTNGVSKYYSTMSNNGFTYKPANETSGTENDGVITVKLPIDAPVWARGERDNYSFNNGIMAGLQRGTDGKNYAIYSEASIFTYAALAADKYIDISQYDKNRDGYISPTELAFVIVYSGREESALAIHDEPGVWAHSWQSNNWRYEDDTKKSIIGDGLSCLVDGKRIYKYTLIGELFSGVYDKTSGKWSDTEQMQFGTICHELGHDLGLMDLYDTEGHGYNENVDMMSVMAKGSWGCDTDNPQPGSVPTQLDAFSKLFLKFAGTPTDGVFGKSYTMNANGSGQAYNILRINTDDKDIYYLVENRRCLDYDTGIGGTEENDYFGYKEFSTRQGGIVVWRIDAARVNPNGVDWTNNMVNTDSTQFGVMQRFHCDASGKAKNKEPFWGGAYYGDGSTLALPYDDSGNVICLDFNDSSSSSMTVTIRSDLGLASPVFEAQPGFHSVDEPISITCPVLDATIYYTLDGTEPTAASPVFSDPITIKENATIKAIAVKDGRQSTVTTAEYKAVSVRCSPSPVVTMGQDKAVYMVVSREDGGSLEDYYIYDVVAIKGNVHLDYYDDEYAEYYDGNGGCGIRINNKGIERLGVGTHAIEMLFYNRSTKDTFVVPYMLTIAASNAPEPETPTMPETHDIVYTDTTVIPADNGIRFTIQAELAKLQSVQVDNKILAPKEFDAVSGSTIITLHADYLATLSAGEHTLCAQFSDGSAVIRFTNSSITPATTPPPMPTVAGTEQKPPQTGDDAASAGFAMLAVAAIFAAYFIWRKRRAKN